MFTELFYFYGNLFKMKRIAFVLVVIVFFSCKQEDKFVPRNISKVEINHLLEDSLLNVRALEIMNDTVLIFPFDRYTVYSNDIGYDEGFWVDTVHSTYPIMNEEVDTLNGIGKIESKQIRSIASNYNSLFLLNIESPAFINKIKLDTVLHANLRLQKVIMVDDSPKAFYDSMDFWNDNEGIAIGDPTEECMSIIITRDGGETWTKLSCDDLPKSKAGEAAFAASDTNIAIVGDNTWVATGGKASRVLYSPDKGKTWTVFETPIVQGLETTGMYSIDFYDELTGFAIGGDYTKPDDNAANKIRTADGGKTWELVAQNQNPGYRSCVQYIPNGRGKELVAIGFKGIDYSNDYGSTWKRLSDEGFYTIRFLNDSVAYAAGAGRISKLTFREE